MRNAAFVTCADFASLAQDDRLALEPLEKRGIKVSPEIWDNPEVSWRNYDLLVLRSCWDYHVKLKSFSSWIDRMREENALLQNPPSVVSWNLKKTYLKDLEEKGVPILPTLWLDKGEKLPLKELLKAREWEKVVVKPVISAGAHRTWISTTGTAEQDQERLQALLEEEMIIIQPFLPEIQSQGEWSLIFFNGNFSHAVVKKPKEGDFRVQEKHGGTTRPANPPHALLEQARGILSLAGEACLYARVDGVELDGKLHLMELELIEPALFLSTNPEAPERFADAVTARL